MSLESVTDKRAKLSPKWQRRFAVFDEGRVWQEFRKAEAYKRLTFWERISIDFNIWAFFLGVLYYVFMGIPKRAVGIALVSMLIMLVAYELDVNPRFYKHIGVATSVCFAMFANYYYYLKITKDLDSFDPFKGLREED